MIVYEKLKVYKLCNYSWTLWFQQWFEPL